MRRVAVNIAKLPEPAETQMSRRPGSRRGKATTGFPVLLGDAYERPDSTLCRELEALEIFVSVAFSASPTVRLQGA